ncbi:MAG: phosphatidylserine decarboxylase, partial [Planctomycetota bacterium]
LCPTDYHRYHYPDSGRHVGMFDLGGSLHSVNPIALAKKPNVFGTNHRRISYLTTSNFGRLAYVEVGAMGVGRIVQTHDEHANFSRGDEKGHFAFGGSTILVFGQPGYWRPDDDLLANTAEERETFVKLGNTVASSTRRSAERGKVVTTGAGETYTVPRG